MQKHTTFFVQDFKPIEFCGKTFFQLNLNGAYQLPFAIEPTKGEHDYNTCEQCKIGLQSLVVQLTEKFNGNNLKRGFPFCCTAHANLIKLNLFKRDDYTVVPEMTALKVIYTNQHIGNNLKEENWYKIITDYIDWAVDSLGLMPRDCGEPLYRSDYLYHVSNFVEQNKKELGEKGKQILQHINLLKQPNNNTSNPDISILLSTYEKWLKTFPFELNSYFGTLKQHYENQIIILDGTPETNIYSGMSKAKMHTKITLIEALINLTNDLLTQINGIALYENGLITDANKIKLELVISSRKMKLQEGYKNNSPDEERQYRRIIKEWFKDEKKFIDEITPLLKIIPSQQAENKSKSKALKINQIALIHFYESNQITRENANEIAAQYGYTSTNSGEGLFQDYTFYCNTSNRKEKPTPCTPKKLKNKIALFESIIPHLVNGAKKRAIDEIKILKTAFANEYN